MNKGLLEILDMRVEIGCLCSRWKGVASF